MKFKTNVLVASTIVALSVLSLPSLAESADAKAPVNTSWQPYVGIAAGYGMMDTKVNFKETVIGGGTNTSEQSSSSKGLMEKLFIGMQKQIRRMVVGGELYGFLSQQNGKTYANNGGDNRQETIRRRYGYGLKLKAGYLVNPSTNIYAHGGVERARIEYKGTTILQNISQSFKKEKNLWGFPFGAGVETDVAPNWKVRGEYTYTFYRSWETGNLRSLDESTSKLTPHQHSILVGVSYHM